MSKEIALLWDKSYGKNPEHQQKINNFLKKEFEYYIKLLSYGDKILDIVEA